MQVHPSAETARPHLPDLAALWDELSRKKLRPLRQMRVQRLELADVDDDKMPETAGLLTDAKNLSSRDRNDRLVQRSREIQPVMPAQPETAVIDCR